MPFALVFSMQGSLIYEKFVLRAAEIRGIFCLRQKQVVYVICFKKFNFFDSHVNGTNENDTYESTRERTMDLDS